MVSLKDVTGIGAKTAERMKEAGITSIEKLANADLKELSEIKGIGKSSAQSYIEEAKKILKTIEKEEKPKEPKKEKEAKKPPKEKVKKPEKKKPKKAPEEKKKIS